MKQQRISCHYIPGFDQYELRFVVDNGDSYDVPSLMEWKTETKGRVIPALLTLETNVAQELFNDLWSSGLRPANDRGFKPSDVEWLQEQLAKFINKATQ